MQDWERVIEERRRMQRLVQKQFDTNLDRDKILKARKEEEKKVPLKSWAADPGLSGDGGPEGIEFWTLEADFVVS